MQNFKIGKGYSEVQTYINYLKCHLRIFSLNAAIITTAFDPKQCHRHAYKTREDCKMANYLH
jgi:hypothetical protein